MQNSAELASNQWVGMEIAIKTVLLGTAANDD